MDKLVSQVTPEAWRRDLLLSRERSSGARAKTAAREIAKQLAHDVGGSVHLGPFKTDAAEAVLVGYHAVRALGWARREPAVRRYQNGAIIPVDKKTASTTSVPD